MQKLVVSGLVAVSILSMPAAAQVRPGDCRPILPVLDKAAEIIPQNVVTPQAAPEVAAKRKFLGLPFLLPLIGIAGGCAAFCGGGNHHDTPPPPVSPA
jgi:hypothetical protein